MWTEGLWVAALLASFGHIGRARAEENIPAPLEMGFCAKVHLVQDFDIDKFQGTWYLQEEVPNTFAEVGLCSALSFSRADGGMNMSTEAWNLNNERVSQEIFLSARLANATRPYFLMIKENIPQVEYRIADTDYVSYACTYTCFQIIGAFRVELFFVTTRDAHPPAATLRKCDPFFHDHNIDTSKLVRVDQTSEFCNSHRGRDNLSQLTKDADVGMLVPSEEATNEEASISTTGASSDLKQGSLSGQENYGDQQTLTRNYSSSLKSEKDTDLMISLLEDDPENDCDPVCGNSSRATLGWTWKIMVCLIIAFHLQSILS